MTLRRAELALLAVVTLGLLSAQAAAALQPKVLAGPPEEFTLHVLPAPYFAPSSSAMVPLKSRSNGQNANDVYEGSVVVDAPNSLIISIFFPKSSLNASGIAAAAAPTVSFTSPNGPAQPVLSVSEELGINLNVFPCFSYVFGTRMS
jgi:hypothetical protein